MHRGEYVQIYLITKKRLVIKTIHFQESHKHIKTRNANGFCEQIRHIVICVDLLHAD